jgi:hypothetical protein
MQLLLRPVWWNLLLHWLAKQTQKKRSEPPRKFKLARNWSPRLALSWRRYCVTCCVLPPSAVTLPVDPSSPQLRSSPLGGPESPTKFFDRHSALKPTLASYRETWDLPFKSRQPCHRLRDQWKLTLVIWTGARPPHTTARNWKLSLAHPWSPTSSLLTEDWIADHTG